MSKSSYLYSFLKGIVICHGKSEKLICGFIKSNLRIKIEIDSDKKGKKSIQITSVIKFLNGEKYKNVSSFKKNFDDIEPIKDRKKLPDYFKVFIIMDTDDCDIKQKKVFKEMNSFIGSRIKKFLKINPCLKSIGYMTILYLSIMIAI